MRGTPSELGLMHSVCYSAGGSIYKNDRMHVLKIANSEDETCHFNIGEARSACLCLTACHQINVW